MHHNCVTVTLSGVPDTGFLLHIDNSDDICWLGDAIWDIAYEPIGAAQHFSDFIRELLSAYIYAFRLEQQSKIQYLVGTYIWDCACNSSEYHFFLKGK